MYILRRKIAWAWVCGLILTVEVEAQSTGQVARQFYHNTTAHYNALFIARKQYEAIKEALRAAEEPADEEIMPVYLEYDSSQTESLSEQIEECIKKSSLVIQYHPDSKWADEAYLLLGHGWHYSGESQEAIKAFRYLGRKAKTKRMKRVGQIALLRTYVKDSLLEEAQRLAKYIARDPPREKVDRLEYLLSLAYLAQRLERRQALIRYLLHGIPLAKKDKYLQTRLYFILAQSYESLGKDVLASAAYKKCSKRLLPYRFYLEAKLRSWASSQAESEKELKKLHKRFKKQLKENKNRPFRYHILYHWARMEQKRGEEEEAHSHYLASASFNTENKLILGRCYEQIAAMFYKREEMMAAATYYDSAVLSLPETAKGFHALKKHSEILQRLSNHYQIKYKEDSLLRLSGLSQDSLAAFLQIRQAEETARLESERLAEAKAEKASASASRSNPQGKRKSLSSIQTNNTKGGRWYFYNPSQVAKGQRDFEKTWGNTPLSDNWRQGGGGKTNAFRSTRLDSKNASAEDTTSLASKESAAEASEEGPAVSIASLMADIPQDEASKQASISRIQGAYYGIGNIYYFELNKKQKGISVFLEMIDRFPGATSEARVLYLLAREELLSQTDRSLFSNKLRKNYADSVYVKLLDNPNYLIEQSAAVRELKAQYKTAYNAFLEGKYKDTRHILLRILGQQLEENSFTDNATLLDVLVDAKLGLHHIYQYRLHTFMQSFPKSELLEEAKQRIQSAEAVQKRKTYSSLPQYTLDKPSSHVLLWSCKKKEVADSLYSWLPEVFRSSGLELPAQVATILLDNNLWTLLIPNFRGAEDAMNYLLTYRNSSLPDQLALTFADTEVLGLAAGEQNLLTIFTVKDIELYSRFFEQHYLP